MIPERWNLAQTPKPKESHKVFESKIPKSASAKACLQLTPISAKDLKSWSQTGHIMKTEQILGRERGVHT